MGECGCGEIVPCAVFRFGNAYILINRYPGCTYCGEPPSVDVLFFDEEGYRYFGQDYPPVVVAPDEYGGNYGEDAVPLKYLAQFAFPLPVDLADAAEEVQDMEIDAYDGIGDYLRDNGLRIMRRAVQIAEDRRRKQKEAER